MANTPSQQQQVLNHLERLPTSLLTISPVSTGRHITARGLTLPLNLIAVIISYIDDVADYARMLRTSRLLYYMTLPLLYAKVSLRSRPEPRSGDESREDYGSGSPFCMALSGLASNNSAPLVKEFQVCGSWPEPSDQEVRRGVVPDGTLLLGIAMRAVIDKMTNVKSFSWDLDTKPMRTVYQGLAARSSLTSLTLRFSSSRAPRPISTIPPFPNLRSLCIMDLDPLCYPDDVSVLLLGSKKLEDLRMSWTPRMGEAESDFDLRPYFARCIDVGYKMPLKHISLQNYYGVNIACLEEAVDQDTIESATLFNSFGPVTLQSSVLSIDDAWLKSHTTGLKRLRVDGCSLQQARWISKYSGLEEFYMVGSGRNLSSNRTSLSRGQISPDNAYAGSTPAPTPGKSTPGRASDRRATTFAKEYIYALTTKHGRFLKNLLLSDDFLVTGEQIGKIVSSCPNLEQLGLAVSTEESGSALKYLIPFLTKLQAVRILATGWHELAKQDDQELQDFMNDPKGRHALRMQPESTLKWVALGDFIFKFGRAVQVPDEDGLLEWRKEVTQVTLDDVKHIHIWGLDKPEI